MPALLQQIIDRHGGLGLWQSCEFIVARLTFGGLAFASRFNRAGLRERTIKIATREREVVFNDYPDPRQRGIFTPDVVKIESQSGEIISERHSPRTAFRSVRRYVWWDDLDLLYFAGYAVWNYLTMPFLLLQKDVEVKEIDSWKENDEVWRRLTVRFPAAIPTHCREQVFYFDKNLLLRRHDYNPEIFAPRAKAAHYCYHHKSFNGFTVATKRKVLPRTASGHSRPWPVLVWIDIADVALE